MPRGGGKYDAACTQAREATEAEGVVLIVLHGSHGSGFSVQGSARVTHALPRLLRSMADQIEADLG